MAWTIGAASFTAGSPVVTPCLGYGCPLNVYESYRPCILGYSGFQVARQYVNPSTWTFTLQQGSTGYLYYEYNVTKGLDYFLRGVYGSWTIWQTYRNGSGLLAEISGSTVIHVQYIVPNEFPMVRPNQTYVLGVQLYPVRVGVSGNLVSIAWSVQGLQPGSYPIEAPDLEWHTINIIPQSLPPETINATSETFSATCGTGGSVSFNG